ncbi:MAG: putative hydro-lyase [Dehalococcoidia bacterium]
MLIRGNRLKRRDGTLIEPICRDPKEIRALIRRGELVRPTAGLAPDYAQANLVVLPKEMAFDFLLFCQRNPRPCPILEVLEPGRYEPALTTKGADLRVDVSLYRIYRHGELQAEETDVTGYWHEGLVSFVLGCSFTFESALTRAGMPLRHLEEGKNVAMYVTSIEARPAGMFSGPIVVSMRPIHESMVGRAVQITSRFPAAHGAPLHIGDPEKIGIADIEQPDYGDYVEIRKDEVPVFWACGVTPQAVAVRSRPPFMITHSPGHMFVTDILNEELAVL